MNVSNARTNNINTYVQSQRNPDYKLRLILNNYYYIYYAHLKHRSAKFKRVKLLRKTFTTGRVWGCTELCTDQLDYWPTFYNIVWFTTPAHFKQIPFIALAVAVENIWCSSIHRDRPFCPLALCFTPQTRNVRVFFSTGDIFQLANAPAKILHSPKLILSYKQNGNYIKRAKIQHEPNIVWE